MSVHYEEPKVANEFIISSGAKACQKCDSVSECDLRLPSCSNCEDAGNPCLTYHSRNHTEVPRNYVTELEAEVRKLTQENRELRERATSAALNGEITTPCSPGNVGSGSRPTSSPIASDTSSNHVQDLVQSVRDVVVEPSRQPTFLGQSGGITLARLVISAIRVDALPSPLLNESRPSNPLPSSMAAEASLPPRHAADYLVDVYFQYQTPHLPIVERSRVEEAIESAYQTMNGDEVPGRGVERDLFICFMILAIALCDVSNSSGGRPSQSEGCFRSAIGWYEKVAVNSKSDMETLRNILLLAQFIALCPSSGSLWHLTGTALRLCIDMGLHWETDDQAVNMSAAMLYDRRRLWYSTYQFDRILCITLGRPFGIIDESIRVPLPNPWAINHGTPASEFDIHSQRAHNHLFLLSRLESEIKHVQHSQLWATKIAYPRANYPVWVQDIQPRLEEWYATIPPTNRAHPSSIFANQAYWDYIYNNALLLLYRPNGSSTTGSHMTSPDATILAFAASCQLIASIKTLQREGHVDMLWKTAHHLFMAGLGVIYSLWQSKDVRDKTPRGSSVSALQSCASTLSALAESFPGVAGCRDAFDTLSSATLNWLVNDNAGEPPPHDGHHQEFRKQAEDLLQQLQPTRPGYGGSAMNMSDMLTTDGFLFSEMLSSAAQWPESQNDRLGDMGFDSVGTCYPLVNEFLRQ